MVKKLASFGMITAFALVYSTQSLAAVGNCKGVIGQTGTVDSVSLGVDDGTDVNISFGFKTSSGTRTVSVKKTIGNSAGAGMYKMLLAAQLTQSKFVIENCDGDQLSGGEIKRD